MKKFWSWTRNEDTGQRELWLDGVIAEETWWGDEVTPTIFKEELNAGGGAVLLHINSPGGDCVAASQIYTMKTFGQIPIGATLFIWANDGGEVARGYRDGKGNASHIGVFIGRNTGAIHSSASRGKVAYSNFKCKTIKGGWNRVGLTGLLSYGEKVDKMIGTPTDIPAVMAAPAVNSTPKQTAGQTKTAKVTGGRLNVRTGPGRENPAIMQLKNGEQVEIIADHGEWAEINYKRHGYVMKQFLTEV